MFFLKKNRLKKDILKKYGNLESQVVEEIVNNYGFSAGPLLLNELNVILQRCQPKNILEIGSGVSTLLISKYLNNGARLFCVDQNLSWMQNIYKKIAKKDNISFICSQNSNDFVDYELLLKLIPFKVDLLIIDGPTGNRFTKDAKRFFHQILSNNSVCVIDDTDRELNMVEAVSIATQFNYRKVDYDNDLIYRQHKFSILFPK